MFSRSKDKVSSGQPARVNDKSASTGAAQRETKIAKERELRAQWQKIIWKADKKFKATKQIRQLSWAGIPSSLRSEVWKKYIIQGKFEFLSLEKFKQLVEQATTNRQQQRKNPVRKKPLTH